MPRIPRSQQPDTPTHLIARGVEKRDIFLDDDDRRFFMNCVRDAFDKHGVKLFSDCLMSNHFHLLAMATSTPIGVAMHLIQTRYAHRFNTRYERVGHLFQNRFHSVPALDIRHFVAVSTYINENPTRAGIVPHVNDWEWSSHHEIIGGDRGLLDLDCLPEVIGMERSEFVEAYIEKIRAGSARRAAMSLAQMIEEAGALCGLTPEQVASGGHGAAFTYARRHVLRWAKDAEFSLPEVATALNCTKQSMYRLNSRL